jgi:hypothetical protein
MVVTDDTPVGRLMNVMEPCRAIRGIVLSPAAPSEIRRWVAEVLSSTDVGRDTAFEVATLASELIADATDHGSDEASIRLTADESTVCVEVFDAPRRSVVPLSGREEGVPQLRHLVLRSIADGWTSDALGDGHFASCEVARRVASD